MDFGLLFFEEADEFVVLLDGFEGLDVDGLAGRTGAVDDAGDAALEFAADGNDEAVAADGDEVFLRGAFGGELAQGGAEGFFDDALLALLLAADAVELGRGVVGEGAVGLDLALDGFGERALRTSRRARRRARRDRGVCRRGGRAVRGAALARRRRRWRGGRWPGTRRLRGRRRGFGPWRRVGWGRRGRRGGWRLCSARSRRSSPVSWCWRRDPGLVGGGAEGEDGFAADGGCGVAGEEGEQRLPLEGGDVGVFDRETGWDRAGACDCYLV